MGLIYENGRIPRTQGQTEATLTAVVELSPTTRRQPWARPPIDVDFQVLMFTASGLLVRFLKVYERSEYQSVKWVRYSTRAQGTYQIRVSTSRCILGQCTDMLCSVLNIWDISLHVFSTLDCYDHATLCNTERVPPIRRASRASDLRFTPRTAKIGVTSKSYEGRVSAYGLTTSFLSKAIFWSMK